jgi:hypothetical protein
VQALQSPTPQLECSYLVEQGAVVVQQAQEVMSQPIRQVFLQLWLEVPLAQPQATALPGLNFGLRCSPLEAQEAAPTAATLAAAMVAMAASARVAAVAVQAAPQAAVVQAAAAAQA